MSISDDLVLICQQVFPSEPPGSSAAVLHGSLLMATRHPEWTGRLVVALGADLPPAMQELLDEEADQLQELLDGLLPNEGQGGPE